MAMAIRRYQIRPITFWLQWTSNYPFWGNIESHPYFVVSENVVCETCFSSNGYVGVSHYFFRQNHLCHFFVFSNWVDWRRKPFWSKDGRGSPHNPNWPPIPWIFWWRTGTYFHKLHVVFSNIEVIFGWSVGIFSHMNGGMVPSLEELSSEDGAKCHLLRLIPTQWHFQWRLLYHCVWPFIWQSLVIYIYIFWYAICYSSSEIYFDILSDTHPEILILPGLILWHSFWHVFWHIFWHSIWPFMIWHFIWHLIWHFLTSLAFCILKCLKYLLSCYDSVFYLTCSQTGAASLRGETLHKIYPLVNWGSLWKWPFRVDLPITNGDFL